MQFTDGYHQSKAEWEQPWNVNRTPFGASPLSVLLIITTSIPNKICKYIIDINDNQIFGQDLWCKHEARDKGLEKSYKFNWSISVLTLSRLTLDIWLPRIYEQKMGATSVKICCGFMWDIHRALCKASFGFDLNLTSTVELSLYIFEVQECLSCHVARPFL